MVGAADHGFRFPFLLLAGGKGLGDGGSGNRPNPHSGHFEPDVDYLG
jgi:hypothetical protein